MWLRQLKSKHIRKGFAVVAGLSLPMIPIVANAQTVTQSYGTSGAVQQGMVVMLDPANASNVAPLINTNTRGMLGVVVAASDTPVTLNSGASGTPTYVATSGKYNVLVSTQNGPIKAGDNISISALDGINMKADANEPLILGKALGSFSSVTTGASVAQLQTSSGTKTVAIGLLRTNIAIAGNPLAKNGSSTAVPAFLQRIATTIAGHPVSAPRIYISIAVLLLSVLITSILLYGGVRSSLSAIGRNPLAKGPVLRGMLQVLSVGVIIFVIGLGGVYLLLKL